ncbi:MAG: DUF3367 domain-containing protein [Ilumatobacter sp.]|nr:DUF3367 domain-containing protein [Ilumatobacter sp.]
MIRDRVVSRLVAVPDRTAAVVLALLAYVPMLATRPGRVSADTKSYLTIDPGGLLTDAASMWDPSVGAGTVPHQNIGYLFPLGPYYWVMERIGSPDWVTQRLLWATMVFAAAYGTYRLTRWMGWTAAAALVAACAYGFTPYLLSYLSRLSVILGPWAALPWMLLLAAQAARTGSWRPAAWFAVTVALVGSVNATSLVLVGLAPVIWLIADALSGRVAVGAVLRAVGRIGVLCAGVSAWWIVGLSVQGTYGLPILQYTEAYEAVESSSTSPEILRGLGYWFFYGGDRLDPWVGPSQPYIDNPAVVALGFLIAGLALAGFLNAFVGRVTAAVLLLVGMIVSVGAAPLGRQTPYGAAFEWLATETTVGAALRSTPRAAPLVVFALALGLGAFTDRVRRWSAERAPSVPGRLVPAAGIVLVLLQLFPWFSGTALSDSLLRDEDLPVYERELAKWLDDNGEGRVYALPGADFAAYRWGGTVDPVLPGLVERPVLYRELVPQGGAGTADLLNAFERRLAEGWFEPEALPAVASVFGVETVVVRNDLEHERYRLARPGPVHQDVTAVLGPPDHVGPLTADLTEIPLVDEATLARRDVPSAFPAVAAFDLGPVPMVEARSALAPVVVAGSGDGVVDLAGAGLLDPARPLLYAATLDDRHAAGDDVAALTGRNTWWVVSDTNRKQARRWSTIGSNLGALEPAGELQFDRDSGNAALDLFDDGPDEQTIAVHRGDVEAIRASSYGNSFAYTPEDAPWFAFDGDPTTAWRGAVFDDPRGLQWEVDLAQPVRADSVTILQPITGSTQRHIVDIEITLDDDTQFRTTLDTSSREVPGQAVPLPDVEFSTMRIEVLSDSRGPLSSYVGQPGVGLAEVVIADRRDVRVTRLPAPTSDDLAEAGVGPAPGQRLTYLMTRQRIDAATPNRDDPERWLLREFTVPDARRFDVVGEVRLSADASDEVLASLLGETPLVRADRRLPGSVASRGASAFDGDPSTAWQTPFGDQLGATVTVEHDGPVRGEEIVVSWLDDGRHTVPTALTVGTATQSWDVALNGVVAVGGVATVAHALPGYAASAGDTTTVTVTGVAEVTSPNYFSGVPEVLPIGIVDVALGDAAPVETSATIDTGCREDLVAIDERPVGVEVDGSVDAALQRGELTLRLCDGPIELSSGVHGLAATPGGASGLDIDRIVLDTPVDPSTAAPIIDGPAVVVDDSSKVAIEGSLAASTTPLWVTLRQSWNEGWTLAIDGESVDGPVLIDGYANGWLVGPSAESRSLEFRWTPQRGVRLGLIVSALFGVLILGVLVRGRRSAPVGVADTPERPLLQRETAVVLGALAVVLVLVAGPLAAVTATAAVLVRPHVRWIGAAITAALLTAVAAGVIGLQWRRDYSIGPDWPSHFAWASDLTWAVVGTIVALALIPTRMTTRRSGRCAP